MNQILGIIRSERMCRDCLNKQYGLSLQREHCQYWQYPGKCNSCLQVRNIVADVVFFHRWRLWFHKNRKTQAGD